MSESNLTTQPLTQARQARATHCRGKHSNPTTAASTTVPRKNHSKLSEPIPIPTPNPLQHVVPKPPCYISPEKPGFFAKLFGATEQPPKPCPPVITKEYGQKLNTELSIIYTNLNKKMNKPPVIFFVRGSTRAQFKQELENEGFRQGMQKIIETASLQDASANKITYPQKSVGELIVIPGVSARVYNFIKNYAGNNGYPRVAMALDSKDAENNFYTLVGKGEFSAKAPK